MHMLLCVFAVMNLTLVYACEFSPRVRKRKIPTVAEMCAIICEREIHFFSLDSAMRLNVCKIALCGTEHFWGSFVFSLFCVGATVVHGTAMEAAYAIASSFEMR